MAHPFNFVQGKKFSRMGASWFVSYCYDDIVPAHLGNWNLIRTAPSRASIYNRTKFWVVNAAGNVVARCETEENVEAILQRNPTFMRLHKYWVAQVMGMNDKKLARNSIGLGALRVKVMAKTCLINL